MKPLHTPWMIELVIRGFDDTPWENATYISLLGDFYRGFSNALTYPLYLTDIPLPPKSSLARRVCLFLITTKTLKNVRRLSVLVGAFPLVV